MAISPDREAQEVDAPAKTDGGGAGATNGKRSPVAGRIGERGKGGIPGGAGRIGRGRPPKPGTAEAPKAVAAPVASPLFTPENTDRLVRLPFTLGAIYTDCAAVELDEKEARELTASAVPVGNGFVTVDPKWLALAVMGISAATIIASKFVCYEAFKRAVAHERAQRDPQPAPVSPAAAPVEPEQPAGQPFPLKPVDPGAAR